MLTYKEKIKDLETILKIAPNNLAVKFIYWRFLQDKYRGIHLLQHNRWTYEKFKAIIFAIFYSQDQNDYIKIPRGDEGRDFFRGDYIQYDKLVSIFSDKYKELTGKIEGTPNTVKKNLFPDLARMNVIERYEIRKGTLILLDPHKSNSVDLIRLRSYLELNQENIQNDGFLWKVYNEASKNIYDDLPLLLFELLMDKEINGKITQDEFLFFITWYNRIYLNERFEFETSKRMILEWRKLNFSARREIISFIKHWAKRDDFKEFKKNRKRDYENLKNQTQEIMSHFKDSQIFVLNENATEFEIVFRKKDDKITRYRSVSPKKEYLKKHNIQKEKGFEFDHMVPFSWSTTWNEALKICSWKNLIYIDAKKHAIKTQSNNIYVYLDKRDEISYICLESNNKEDFLSLKLNIEVLFNMKLFEEIKKYNIELNDYISKNK